ncbi:hypothetical protein B9Q06_08295 [Candidatus Marsarchaeota G2 archaeon ECH_B_2]|uniref:Cytochrome oxidase subunit II copper A binding domain-containing protein n=3 Tax=Candidatus Marsarchaeota group 2 TaxID=2203771 RepID=A0A2R6B7T7_9ARCH|nr:MAG: hypothetical protein B9Q06_08295 [Candidatus Marsarchaeota G2 archaeon ECH_B_2]PSN97685.1 MAG: hypothetical protein B9Q07_11630 [Candidatus Marsarchaeota G2 archaeon ECH_B_3]PSO01456.1 MAG: hypothetical protein B9Q05_08845 [Candidatus Marsarchaeota G2 archaeon ECH_B_1]
MILKMFAFGRKGRKAHVGEVDLAILTVALIAVAISGYVLYTGIQPQSGTATQGGSTPTLVTSTSNYSLTLVITTNNLWNGTTPQPRYWVLTPNGLESSANIELPAHTLIVLTIIDYDSPTPLPTQFAQVTGTVGGVVYLINSTTAGSGNPNLSAATAVSSFNPNTGVAHTFTIPQLGINIPSAPGSVEVAEFYINQTGTFTWHCMDPCGIGPGGWGGAMSTPGWMEGNITVYNP